jgi:hypothetical protein
MFSFGLNQIRTVNLKHINLILYVIKLGILVLYMRNADNHILLKHE